MNNDKVKPIFNKIWGLSKGGLNKKPREERIMEMVQRIVTNVQYDKRKKMQLDVKGIAEEHMISASAVCRQAVAHYIKHNQQDTAADRL